jgi:serine/threonine-protein kinase ULK4
VQLLGGVLEVNPNYVQHVERLGLARGFFDFLSLEHPNNNVHNIRLCRQLVSAGSMSSRDLHQQEVADKVGLAKGSERPRIGKFQPLPKHLTGWVRNRG